MLDFDTINNSHSSSSIITTTHEGPQHTTNHQWPTTMAAWQEWCAQQQQYGNTTKQVNGYPQDVGNAMMMHDIITIQIRWVCPSSSPLPFFDMESRSMSLTVMWQPNNKQWWLHHLSSSFMTLWWASPLATHLTWPTNRQWCNPVTAQWWQHPPMMNTATQMAMKIHHHHPPTVTMTQHHGPAPPPNGMTPQPHTMQPWWHTTMTQ